MFIRVQLPASYERLQVIKEENFPYSTLFHAYMRSIVNLAKRENLTVFNVFGRVEHALTEDTPLELSMTGDAPVTLKYKEDDPEVVAFYKNSRPLSQKTITLMFVRTLLRLTAKYGNSIPELVYLINTLPAADQQTASPAVNRKATPAVVNRKATPAVVNRKATPAVPAAEPVAETTEQIDPATMVHIKKRPGKAAMTDVANRAHKVADKVAAKSHAAKVATKAVDKESAAVSSAEPANESKPVDDVLARAERLKQEVDNGDSKAAEGEKVATNPLLKSFF